jgi:ankyrin repeat protein/L-ascorbate metabolism protein UlaG (beta-lactamase superfamily)
MKKILWILIISFVCSLAAITDMDIRENKFTDEEMIQLVTIQPDYLNKDIYKGDGVLHYVLQYKRFELAKRLVKFGADINKQGENNDTPIMYACLYGDKSLYDWMISHGASTGAREDNRIFNFTAMGGNTDIARDLVNRGFDVNLLTSNGINPLHRAILSGKREMIQFLLDNGADVNQKMGGVYQATPLLLAISRNDLQIAEMIMKNNPNFHLTNAYGTDAFLEAINMGNFELLRLMFQYGYKINNDGFEERNMPLHRAAFLHPEMIGYLIQNGADINKANIHGETAIMDALYADSLTSFNILLDHQAKYNYQSVNGKSVLMIACSQGKIEAVQKLVDLKADLNLHDQIGQTALHQAVLKGNSTIVGMLIDHGADLHLCDQYGMTAYQYAKQYKHLKIAKLLKEKDKKQKDIKTQYAEEFFKKSGKNDLKIYHTGHSGWVLNYKEIWMIFDYYPLLPLPDEPTIDNGIVDAEFLKGKKVFVFVSHEHSDHFSQEISNWQKVNPDIRYFFGFNPNDDRVFRTHPFELPDYTRILPDSSYVFDDLKISTFKSPVDLGVGFVVEYQNLTFLHSGDALYMNNDWPNVYTQSIDKLKLKYPKIDFAFVPITGCGFPNADAVVKSYEYLIESFQPKVIVPMHGSGREESYDLFKETYDKKYPNSRVMLFRYKGDHQKVKI